MNINIYTLFYSIAILFFTNHILYWGKNYKQNYNENKTNRFLFIIPILIFSFTIKLIDKFNMFPINTIIIPNSLTVTYFWIGIFIIGFKTILNFYKGPIEKHFITRFISRLFDLFYWPLNISTIVLFLFFGVHFVFRKDVN